MGSKIDDFKLGDNTSLNPEEKQRLLDLILEAKPEKEDPLNSKTMPFDGAVGYNTGIAQYTKNIEALFKEGK